MRITFFDTETGGIGIDAARKYSIVQLGATVYDTNNPGGGAQFVCYIDESKGCDGSPLSLDPAAMAVNKISEETISTLGLAPVEAVMFFTRFLAAQYPTTVADVPALKQVKELIILGGHNVGYDTHFLYRLFRHAGVAHMYDVLFSHRTVDTASIARFLIDSGIIGARDNKTETLFEFFDVKPSRAHDALCDAIATAQLYERMIEMVRRASTTRSQL